MTATISMAFRDRLLQAYFNAENFQGDDQLYVAVTGEVPRANQSGLTLDEPNAGAYQRAVVNVDGDNWALTGFGEVYNLNDIDFPPPAIGEDWGYLGGWALLDSPDSGITLAVGSLITPVYFTSDLPQLSLGPQAITIGLMD